MNELMKMGRDCAGERFLTCTNRCPALCSHANLAGSQLAPGRDKAWHSTLVHVSINRLALAGAAGTRGGRATVLVQLASQGRSLPGSLLHPHLCLAHLSPDKAFLIPVNVLVVNQAGLLELQESRAGTAGRGACAPPWGRCAQSAVPARLQTLRGCKVGCIALRYSTPASNRPGSAFANRPKGEPTSLSYNRITKTSA